MRSSQRVHVGKLFRLLLALVFIPAAIQSVSIQDKIIDTNKAKLREILDHAAKYCERLNAMVFDFVCHEEIKEQVFTHREKRVLIRGDYAKQKGYPEGQFSYIDLDLKKKKEKSYVYDFQMVKTKYKDEEKRILIEENGKKKHKENVQPKMQRFLVQNIVYGPAGFLSAYWQRHFIFEIIGEDTVENKKAIVLSAIPKASRKDNYNFGKIWVDENDYSILKIAWDPRSVQFFKEEVSSPDGKLRRDLTWVVTYNTEKNGIKFPSKQIIEEVYVTATDKRYPKCLVDITYKNYKFFTVEIMVEYESRL